MIQRKQTITLLLSAIFILIAIFCIPYLGANTYMTQSCLYGTVAFQIVGALVGVFSLIAIFRYKSLKCQKGICTVNIVLLSLLLLTQISLYVLHQIGLSSFYEVLPLLSLLCTFSARSYIQKDQNLLKSADRLR